MDKKTKEKHDIDEFEEYAHLWNLVPGGKGEGIVLLRKVVDSIQNNFNEPLVKTPSFLIAGGKATGKKLLDRAITNSLALEDVRVCPADFFENGIFSSQHFWDSSFNTAHIITDIEQLKGTAEATLWKYVKNRECKYFNHMDRNYSNTICCNGWIIMTCKDADLINDAMLSAVDHIIEIEPLNNDQLIAVLHQKLVFVGVEYAGEEVLKAIVDAGMGRIELVMDFLKKNLILLNAEMKDCLDMQIVNKAKRMTGISVDFDDTVPY